MRATLGTLADSLIARLVPRMDAHAQSECRTNRCGGNSCYLETCCRVPSGAIVCDGCRWVC